MPSEDQIFQFVVLPDISQVNPAVNAFFSDKAPGWRVIAEGLNLQGKCKNKQCEVGKRKLKVWTNFGFGTFHMSETVCKCKCPVCGQFTKGNKVIGIYNCILTGRGMKVRERKIVFYTKTSANKDGQETDDQIDQKDKEVQIEFNQIKVDNDKGFLKMDGTNGQFVKWRYMTLEIAKLKQNDCISF